MVATCSAYGCKEKAVRGGSITFHSFPKDFKRRLLWETQLKRKGFKASNYSKVCSKHFEEKCFNRSKFGGTWLKDDALPTIFDFPKHLLENSRKWKYVKGTEEDASDEVLAFQVAEDVSAAISNPDSTPSLNLGYNLFTSEINLHRRERGYATSEYVIEDEISIKKEVDEDEEDASLLSNKPGSLGEKNPNENHDQPLQNRLKYFIFASSETSKLVSPVVSKQTAWVTHEEALRSAETLFHYMVNQDDVSNVDFNFITNYMKTIKEKISKEGTTTCEDLEISDSPKLDRLAS